MYYLCTFLYNLNKALIIYASNRQTISFDINVQYYFRSVRQTIVTTFIAVTAVVVMIYTLTKIRQEYKQRRNQVAVAPINIVYNPCLNNLQFNPIIVKSKTFLFHSIACLMMMIICFIFYKLNLTKTYTKYNQVQHMLINFYLSIVTPLIIYWQNPPLRKYLRNDLLNDLFL